MQQQKQQQLQQQHLRLNEKLILIQFNLISIDFGFWYLFKVKFARECDNGVSVFLANWILAKSTAFVASQTVFAALQTAFATMQLAFAASQTPFVTLQTPSATQKVFNSRLSEMYFERYVFRKAVRRAWCACRMHGEPSIVVRNIELEMKTACAASTMTFCDSCKWHL